MSYSLGWQPVKEKEYSEFRPDWRGLGSIRNTCGTPMTIMSYGAYDQQNNQTYINFLFSSSLYIHMCVCVHVAIVKWLWSKTLFFLYIILCLEMLPGLQLIIVWLAQTWHIYKDDFETLREIYIYTD